MSYLVDTNVLSELRRKQPDARVVAWVEQRPAQALYLSHFMKDGESTENTKDAQP